MATCADCGGYLESTHRCRGRFKRRVRLAIVAAIGAVAGGLLPFLVSQGFQIHPASLAATMVLGALLAVSLYRAVPPSIGPR